MSTFKRILSFVLAMVMVAEMLPMHQTHAEEIVETQVEETVPVTIDEAPVEATATCAEETTVPVTEETVPVSEETVFKPEETIPAPEETTPETEAETTETTVPEETVGDTVISDAVGDPMVDGTDDSYNFPTLIRNGQSISGSVSDNTSFVNGALVMDKNDWFYFTLDERRLVTIQVSSSSSPTVVLFDNNGNNIASRSTIEGYLSPGLYTVCVQNRKTTGTTYYTISLSYCTHTNYTYNITPATCYTDGYTEYTCYSCGERWTVTIPASHKTGIWTVVNEPTCAVEGKETARCSSCNNLISRSIATLPHTYGDEVVSKEPTCQKTGVSVKTCVECGFEKEETVAKLPHQIENKVLTVAPAYNMKGLHSGSCVTCGTALTESIRAFTTEYSTYAVEESVVAIAVEAFYQNLSITGVIIPDSVRTIGASAFESCTNLKEVVIAEGVTSIGSDAFASCQRLTSITIPNSVTKIGRSAFDGCSSLIKVVIPEGITGIPSYAFRNCSKLTDITLPSRVETIGDSAFWGCKALPCMIIPDSVTAIGNGAFIGCESLTNISIPDSVESIGESAFSNCHNLASISLPASLKTIAALMFSGCYSLASITIPDTVTSIAFGAFQHCRMLTSITIPASVKTVGCHAFTDCTKLDRVFFTGNAPGTTSGATPFWNAGTNLVTAYYPYGNSTWTTAARDALAKSSSLTWKTCSHSFTGATCSTTAVCKNCGAQGSYAPHKYGDATCTTAKACTECGQTIGKPLGHSFTKYTSNKDATCTQDGTKTAKCDRCEEKETVKDFGSALGHRAKSLPAKAPTCTETGLTEGQQCSRCSEITLAQEVIPALGHEEIIDAALDPTCLATGLTEGKHCARCTEVLIPQETIPALGHEEIIDTAVEPDCTNVGYTEGKHCGRCAFVFIAQEEIPALSHDEIIEQAVAPTCEMPGVTEYRYCARCREVFAAREEIPALGHAYAAGICQTCGYMLPSDFQLYSGKSVTLKPMDPATGKAYAAKQLTWSMDSRYEPYATLKNGKLTAKAVVAWVRMEVKATIVATGAEIPYLIDIYPAVTQLEVKQSGEIVNGKTLLMDYTEESLTLKAEAFPLDTLEKMTWTVSDKKGQFANYEISGDTLTIYNPTGKAGTVTIKAAVDAGVKKNVTVKITFGSFARNVTMTALGTTTLRGGESLALSAWISEPAAVTKPGIVWSTSDKTAATVSNGKVTAKNVAHPTLVTITATSKDGQAHASLQLKIIPKKVGQLVLMHDGAYVTNSTVTLNAGETRQITASSTVNGIPAVESVTWSSSKATVATVADGLITAVGSGSAKITATASDGRKAVINVKITTLVSDMTISTKDGKNLVQENGETLVEIASSKGATLAATVYPAKANKAVTWEIIEGDAYANISSSGKITANKDLTSVKYVTVKATAKDGSGYSETIRVRIRPLATGVQIYSQNNGRTTFSVRTPENWWVRSNTTLTVDLDETGSMQLLSHVYPYYGENNDRNAIQGVTWKSSSTKIATIDQDGNVTFLKAGTVTITATANDGSGKKVTFKLKIV